MAYGSETYDIDWPPQVISNRGRGIEKSEAGPIILEYLDEEYYVDSGESLEIKVDYAYAKYPVVVKWKEEGKVLESQRFSARGGTTSLNLYNIQYESTYEVVIRDPRTKIRDSSYCTVKLSDDDQSE